MVLTERKGNYAAEETEILPVFVMETIFGGDHTTGILRKDEMHDGSTHCSGWSEGYHQWRYVGISRPGKIMGDLWPDYLHRCIHCKKYVWMGSKRE